MRQNNQQNLQELFEKAHQSQTQLYKLLEIGRTRGFSNFINRRQIWPFLMGLDEGLQKLQIYSWKCPNSQKCKQYQSMQKDSQRCLYTLTTHKQTSKYHLHKKQQSVLETMNTLFIRYPSLTYLQGFHSVVSVVLTIFDSNIGYYVVERLAKTYFADVLCLDPERVGSVGSQIVTELVTSEDKNFKRIFQCYYESKIMVFLIPWIMTWFSHVFTSVKTIARIWDYLLSTGPHGIFYLSASFILQSRVDLISQCEHYNQPEIQLFYQQYFKTHPVEPHLEQTIQLAIDLQSKYPITSLEAYQNLDRNSMYREENFYTVIEIHKGYHQKRMRQKKRDGSLKSVALIGGAAIVVIGAMMLAKRNVRVKGDF